MSLICINGQFVEEKDAVVKITDKEYFFDFSVYSSLKIIQGKIFFPEFHVDRLLESAAIIELGHNFNKKSILKWLEQTVAKNGLKDAFLRIVLIGDARENKNARLYIAPLTGVHFYPDKFYKNGVKAITYEGERLFPKAKTKDLLLSFTAYRLAEKNEAIDALLIDRDGNIREGTRSNFFAIKGNTLIMPPAHKILEGITLKVILDICGREFILKREDIPFLKINEYDEFFVTSTLFNILPLNQINNIKLNSNFDKTKKIQKIFQNYYKKEILKI